MKTYVTAVLLLLLTFVIAHAGEADVTHVEADQQSDGSYKFDVTVAHKDEGWEHYADKWDVVGADDSIFGTRTLYHPHVNEQPFTRSLSGVKIPKGINEVRIRAHDSVHKYGGKVVTVELPR